MNYFLFFQTTRRWEINHPARSYPRRTWSFCAQTQSSQRLKLKTGTEASWYDSVSYNTVTKVLPVVYIKLTTAGGLFL